MIKVTDREKEMISEIIRNYDCVGIHNTEFYNIYGYDDENKKWRGVFSSLKKKGIINHENVKDCFNPIYPSKLLVDVCRENGIDIPDGVMDEIRDYVKGV